MEILSIVVLSVAFATMVFVLLMAVTLPDKIDKRARQVVEEWWKEPEPNPTMIVEYSEGAEPLKKEHENDASYDICVDRDIVLTQGRQKLTTGIKVAFPTGLHGFVMPTSGNSLKGMNARKRLEDGAIIPYRVSGHIKVGTVDNCYRGEIGVTFDCYEPMDGSVFIERGTKVAQFFLIYGTEVDIKKGIVFEDTDRGSDGYGSTDK